MQTEDVVIAGRNAFRITGIYLGGVGEQNIVSLQSLNLRPGSANGHVIQELFAPEELVLAAGVYRRIK